MLASHSTTHPESESSQDFLKFQQKARERTERDRLLAEQMEQRRKEKDLEDAARRAEAEERAKIRERLVGHGIGQTRRCSRLWHWRAVISSQPTMNSVVVFPCTYLVSNDNGRQ